MSHFVALVPDDTFNRALVARVHPPEWHNPSPAERYNLVVVGGGTAGLVSALGAAGLGARVALVERHMLGGDCLGYGCVPSKALLRAARAAFDARRLAPYGVRAGGDAEVDFPAVMERMRRLRSHIARNDAAERLKDRNVDVFLGDARFTGPDTLEVDGARLRFTRAVIATGGRAASLSLPGLTTPPLTNESIFSLTSLPARLGVIGGGPIGCELAQAFQRFGSAVTLLHRGPRLLPHDDAEAGAIVHEALVAEGVKVHLGAKPSHVTESESGKRIHLEGGGAADPIEVDAILVAVGRAPNVEGLGLEAAGVAWDAAGVAVDDRLRTSNARVFAAGDVCSRMKFTHAADAMARVVLQNALFCGRRKASSLVIPWCTYTDPEVAHVGILPDEAAARGDDVATYSVSLDEVDRAVLDGETRGFARLHVEARSGRILGATVVARHAGEMMGEVSLAMTEGLSAAALSRAIVPYPTQAEVWKRLGDAHQRTRLTPWLQRVLARAFSFWRGGRSGEARR